MCNSKYFADEDYAGKLRTAMDRGGVCTFDNDGEAKAIAIVREFVRDAKGTVRLFCKSLNHDIYDNDDVVDSFCHALKKGVKMDIVIQSPEMDSHSRRLKNLFRKYSDKVTVSTAYKDPALSQVRFNMCLVDNKFARMETGPEERKGQCYVNNIVESIRVKAFLDRVKEGRLSPLNIR